MKFEKKAKKAKTTIGDDYNPNMIPVKRRGFAGGSESAEPDNDDEFDNLAPVDRSEVLTMHLDDEEDGEEGGFSINKSFAEKYEHRKKMEEISNLKEKYGDNYNDDGSDDDSESDEEEDENGELLTKELDLQIMKTIGLIRAKKPEVYDSSKNFFAADAIKSSREAWNQKQDAKKAAGKKMTLKDYHRERLLESGGADEDESEDTELEEPVTKTYLEEQEELRQSFKTAVGDDEVEADDDDDDFLTPGDAAKKGGLFTVREKTQAELDQEEADYKQFLVVNMKRDEAGEGLKDWTEFASGKEDAVQDPTEKFLMSFILNKGWVDEDADESKIPTYEQIVKEEHLDEDEAEEEEVDRFERAYNFRFEENDGATIVTHARNIDDSMRRKDTRRTDKRASAKERKEEQRRAQGEELKRLKNLKKEEMREKLQKIAEVAGADASKFEDVDLDEDFDPDKFDQMMAARFNDDYYATGETLKKPVFDDGLDLDDMDYGDEDAEFDDPDVTPPPGEVNERDFDIHGLVEYGLIPKTDEGKILKKAKATDRLALLAVVEEQEKQAKKVKKNKRKHEEVEGDCDDSYPPVDNEDFNMDADFEPGGDMYGDEAHSGKKTKKDKKKELREKKKLAKKEAVKAEENLLENIDEYLQLDHEDMIGDLPTRFKYRKVEPEDFGLSAVEILMAPEPALNELVPLKHIAPFRPEMRKERDRQIWSKTKKKKIKKFKDALEAAKAGKSLDEWEEEKKKIKREASLQEKKALGQAAKKAAKKAKKAAIAATEGSEANDLVAKDSHDDALAPDGDQEDVASKVESKGDVSDSGDSEAKPAIKKSEKKNVQKNKDGNSAKKQKVGTGDKKAGGAKDSTSGGITSDRLASYGMPSRKK
ncbi:KRI1-like family C-terminal-domain-containing protein [Chytriomyces sp. MP71]|nr:KRI1-like family C-terminal-domain-containing protein [Chytriomyces sp. MP71]